MNYSIALTEQARTHIRYLMRQGVMNRSEQVRLINAMAARLQYQPTMAQGSVKALRQPNVLAVSYELRVQPWRVFYNVDDDAREVQIEVVGYKVREKLLVDGKEVEL
jgi:hypothetical protein